MSHRSCRLLGRHPGLWSFPRVPLNPTILSQLRITRIHRLISCICSKHKYYYKFLLNLCSSLTLMNGLHRECLVASNIGYIGGLVCWRSGLVVFKIMSSSLQKLNPNSQAYTSKRCILIQVLPQSNAYRLGA